MCEMTRDTLRKYGFLNSHSNSLNQVSPIVSRSKDSSADRKSTASLADSMGETVALLVLNSAWLLESKFITNTTVRLQRDPHTFSFQLSSFFSTVWRPG